MGTRKTKDIAFVNVKFFEGGKFSGATKEFLKSWAKKVKIFMNSQHSGMRKALELAEDAVRKMRVADLGFTDQEFAEEANEKLHDFLMTYSADEAMQVVEPYSGEGFEAWRQLKRRYTQTGGATQIDRTMRMMNKKA